MLIGGILVLCLYETFIKRLFIQLKSYYDETKYAAKYHKGGILICYEIVSKTFFLDPDMLNSRLLAQDKRTQLLQEKYNQDAERHKEKEQKVRYTVF